MRYDELMVGDWVLKEGCANPYRMTLDDFKNWAMMEDNGGTDFYDDFSKCYTPIIITKEFLEKNGFKFEEKPFLKELNVDHYVSQDGRIWIGKWSNSNDKDWCCHIDNEDYETVGSSDIQFVHELQHLFKLCNYKKELIP